MKIYLVSFSRAIWENRNSHETLHNSTVITHKNLPLKSACRSIFKLTQPNLSTLFSPKFWCNFFVRFTRKLFWVHLYKNSTNPQNPLSTPDVMFSCHFSKVSESNEIKSNSGPLTKCKIVQIKASLLFCKICIIFMPCSKETFLKLWIY